MDLAYGYLSASEQSETLEHFLSIQKSAYFTGGEGIVKPELRM